MDESEGQGKRDRNDAPYVPLPSVGNDALRASHALEYIAAQLWEIRQILEQLTERDKAS